MKITEELFKLQDKEYALFEAKLTPTIDKSSIIGVRVPILRNLVKDYKKDPESKEFLNTLPHKYYEENMLHSLLISEIKDYDECIQKLNKFLPYIDNWAVCDTLSPKVFKRHKEELLKEIKTWCNSKETYTVRFGIDMLMTHYLDEDFKEEYLSIPSKIHSNEYYINMMISWYYATALAKKWQSTIKYLEDNKLDTWIHNKTIQKAKESYRITKEQKEYLTTLKRSK